MGGIGVITNPLSRENKRRPDIIGQLGYVLGEKGSLEQPVGLDALDEVARRFRERDIDILCINGGDGTMHRAMTAMKRAYAEHPLPRVAVLPCGTMNIIANSIGIRRKPADVLHRIVRAYHGHEELPTTQRSLLRVDDAKAPPQFGFLFGNGIIAGFLEAYYEGGTPTPTKAAAVLARGVASTFVRGEYVQRLLKPFRGQLTLDGEPWSGEQWTAVAAGTVEQIGLGFKPFHRVRQRPGEMHVVGIGGSVTDLARELPRIYRGRPLARPGDREGTCRVLQIDSQMEQTFMIDGDFHRASHRLTLSTSDTIDFILTP